MPSDSSRGAARRLHFVLAGAGGPVSLDALVASGAWRPAELWHLIEEARQGAIVAADPAAPGHFRWADDARRTEAIAAATPEDLSTILRRAPLPALLLDGARAAAAARDFAAAGLLYRALALSPDRSLFPGGEADWVAAVIESIRSIRSMWGLPAAVLEEATASAESRGDLAAQAVLLAARGLQCLGADPRAAQALYDRAREAAEALGDPAIRVEVRVYVAVSLVFLGRLAEGIAAFEEMLGDVPGEVFGADAAGPLGIDGPTPASPIAVLANGYANAGDYPRAFDLLHRMVDQGARAGSAALEAQGKLFLAATHLHAGDPAAAEPLAEAALAHWRRPGGEPLYAWFAFSLLALVRASQDRAPEARALLAEGIPHGRAGGFPLLGGTVGLALLERLEEAGATPVDGFSLEGELARLEAAPSPFARGIALAFRARSVLRREGPRAGPRAAPLLVEAISQLRAAGARHELQRALRDAADVAEAAGDAAGAARLRGEADEAWRTAPAPAPEAHGGPRALRLAAAVLDLGQLGALAPRRDGLWGEVAARLCRDFGAERAALVELRPDGPALLAARGAAAWQTAVLARLRASRPSRPTFEPALVEGTAAPDGQLVLVPFGAEALERHGVIALENRYAPAAVGPEDAPLLGTLGRQLGILLANVALWRELLEARQRLEQENRYYRESAPAATGGGRFVGNSSAMRAVLDLVARVAPTAAPVLVTGETGVGKELVSREVHLLSPRSAGPFIAVHVAALAPGLVASALFGHERGAFTGATEQSKGRFELADGGTVFLDEIGELSPEDQVRLLRVLQEGVFERVGGTRPIRSDFRVVAATNRDLEAEVRAGRFREDLFFRLSAFPVRVPPLRERREEIPTLALWFMERANRTLGTRFAGIGEADMERLVAYAWPGNVRELEHVVERAALLSEPPRLRVPPLDAGPARGGRGPAPAAAAADVAVDEWVTLEEVERRYVRKVLHRVGGRVNGARGAAELLGLKPSTLQFRIDKLGLRRELLAARKAKPASARRSPPRGSIPT